MRQQDAGLMSVQRLSKTFRMWVVIEVAEIVKDVQLFGWVIPRYGHPKDLELSGYGSSQVTQIFSYLDGSP